jgi:hypothetical protein
MIPAWRDQVARPQAAIGPVSVVAELAASLGLSWPVVHDTFTTEAAGVLPRSTGIIALTTLSPRDAAHRIPDR